MTSVSVAPSSLFHGLTRRELETRIGQCWQALRRAELAGDSKSADHMRDRIDQALDALLDLRGER